MHAAWRLRVEPEDELARRVLGFRRAGDGWAGSYAARRMERGDVWDARFGWVKAEDLPRWEAGERRVGSRWVSAEDDAKRHAEIDKGWSVRTDHFQVQSNHSLAAAAELAGRLERLHAVWRQLFAEFAYTDAQIRRRLDGTGEGGHRGKPMQVRYYATRDEYVRTLRRDQPRIGETLGIYFDQKRLSHFFAGPQQDPGTVRHEVTHQLFHESRRAARGVGVLANFWAIEGVACFMESLRVVSVEEAGTVVSLGGALDGRLPAAVHRRLIDDYYVPLAELTRLGMGGLQKRADLPRLYSQSAGLATFFMNHRGGVYRRAFVEYLVQIYAGRDDPATLAELTGQSYDRLDQEYEAFLLETARRIAKQAAGETSQTPPGQNEPLPELELPR